MVIKTMISVTSAAGAPSDAVRYAGTSTAVCVRSKGTGEWGAVERQPSSATNSLAARRAAVARRARDRAIASSAHKRPVRREGTVYAFRTEPDDD